MGMGRQGFGRRVSATIEDSVPPPRRADLRWIVRIDDSSGLPITGGDVVVTTWMPDHFHPAAKPAIVTELGEGRYEVDPINLFMPGLWEIVIATTTDSIARDEVLFVFCVD